ncbi:MAG: C1 family peptidase [Bacteroidales bacterium]|nr:C1 family peptidase [Bacteroidales bacterium]
MKKLVVATLAALVSLGALAQKPKVQFPEYEFETVKANPITSVKNQNRSGTCWAFSALGFFESEAIRICNIKDTLKYPDFSEMFVVHKSYSDRADKYVRLDGKLAFAAGSEADDVLDIIRDYGIVPQSAYSGMNYGSELPEQAEMDAVLKAYVNAVAKVPNRNRLSTAWKKGFDGVLDAYLGEIPTQFKVDGKNYTAQSYRDAMKIDPKNYITLTSYTHHPFYTDFAIEVCDNWRWDKAWNVPIDELMNILDAALNNGYTAAWGADVSDPGFTRDGLAVLVDTDALAAGSDKEHWVGKEEEKVVEAPKEKVATQESRQEGFDRKYITDDHGMQIFGIARDQFGNKYYMVKNSWGDTGKYHGIWYATEAYVRNQTLDIMIHKDCLPRDLKNKIGIK